MDDDDALEAIWKKEYSLQAFVASDQFKSYDDLKKRLDYVLGNKRPAQRVTTEELDYDTTSQVEQKRVSEEEVLQKLERSAKASKSVSETTSSDEDEEDPLSYFAKLADS